MDSAWRSAPHLPIDWVQDRGRDLLLNQIVRIDRRLLNHVHVLDNRTWTPQVSTGWTVQREPISEFYGDVLDTNHSFCHTPLVPFSFHEPQLTKGLGHFMGEHYKTKHTDATTRLFIESTFRSVPDPDKTMSAFLNATTDRSIQIDLVTTEEPIDDHTQSSRRTDLVIRGTHNDKIWCMIFELKIDHIITNQQLAHYKSKLCSQHDSTYLFVITKKVTPTDHIARRKDENRDWLFLSWRTILRLSDRAVTERDHSDVPDDFHRFRRSLWVRMYEIGREYV